MYITSPTDVGIFNTSQISISEVAPVERSSAQISASQIGMIQTHILEIAFPQNGSEKFRTTQISTNRNYKSSRVGVQVSRADTRKENLSSAPADSEGNSGKA